MELCSHKHDEIVFDRGNCPLCEALAEIEDYKQVVETKDKEIEQLESTII